QARQAGQDLERYLEMLKRSAEELQEELRPAATERVRRSLALTKLADEEQIKVQPAEVDEEIEKIVASSGRQAQQMRGLFSTADARSAIERSILTRKTLDRLSEIAGGGSAEAEPRKTTEKTKTAGKKKVPAGTKEAT